MNRPCRKCGTVIVDCQTWRKWCLACWAAYARGRYSPAEAIRKRASYQRNKDAINARRQELARQNPEHYRAVWNAKHRRDALQEKARRLAGYAIRSGKLARGLCEHCGEAKTQAHHRDYSKPLDVQWLCLACHAIAHRKYA